MKFYKITTVILFLFLFACDTIYNPLKEVSDSTCGNENDPIPIRKILVEDYTGHKCPNCPDAARILEDIVEKYCDHIIPVGVHVGYFATPDDNFPPDYRTVTGEQLDEYYKISDQGLPNGLVNRSEYNGEIIVGRTNWATAVNLIYMFNPEVDISIESSYDEATNKVTATVTAEYLSLVDYNMNLGLYVTEDSIVSPQKDGAETIEDYIHRHVLRKGINGAFGESFASSAAFGDVLEKTFIFDASEEWNMPHCELVAFISKSATNEIIQAESEHINID